MKILIIDDDLELCQALKTMLEIEANEITFAHDGENGAKLAIHNHYDVIILDHNLPKQNGHSVCTIIRDHNQAVPILILSITIDLDTKVTALEIGADDYLTKPFAAPELIARLHSLLRRNRAHAEPIKIGQLIIDPNRQTVKYQRRLLQLPTKQYQLLEYLAKQPGKLVTRTTIMEKVWELNANIWSNTLDAHLCELRKHLQAETGKKFIHTVSGRGYKLIIPT